MRESTCFRVTYSEAKVAPLNWSKAINPLTILIALPVNFLCKQSHGSNQFTYDAAAVWCHTFRVTLTTFKPLFVMLWVWNVYLLFQKATNWVNIVRLYLFRELTYNVCKLHAHRITIKQFAFLMNTQGMPSRCHWQPSE